MPNKTFSNLAKDGSARVLQVASSIQTYDDTTVAQNSPLAYTSADVTNIAVPVNAAELIFEASTALRISEDSNMATYAVVPAGSTRVIPAGRTFNLYIKGDTADGTLNFYFHIV